MGILWWLIVGVAAGWLAGVITRTDRGIFEDLILGLLGALVAGFFTDSVGGSMIVSILLAAVAAAILVFLKNMILKSK